MTLGTPQPMQCEVAQIGTNKLNQKTTNILKKGPIDFTKANLKPWLLLYLSQVIKTNSSQGNSFHNKETNKCILLQMHCLTTNQNVFRQMCFDKNNIIERGILQILLYIVSL